MIFFKLHHISRQKNACMECTVLNWLGYFPTDISDLVLLYDENPFAECVNVPKGTTVSAFLERGGLDPTKTKFAWMLSCEENIPELEYALNTDVVSKRLDAEGVVKCVIIPCRIA